MKKPSALTLFRADGFFSCNLVALRYYETKRRGEKSVKAARRLEALAAMRETEQKKQGSLNTQTALFL